MKSNITKRRLEWNPDHSSPQEQEMAWVKEYLGLSFEKKWSYLMSLCAQKNVGNPKGKRLEWI
jgi:hypothetical protein